MLDNSSRICNGRSFLFVPGNRPEIFGKASSSDADIIVFDLEDSVGPSSKNEARKNVYTWFSEGGSGLVRVNSTDTAWFEDDIREITKVCPAIVLPKTSSTHDVKLAESASGLDTLVPLLETANGILNARGICRGATVVRALFGSADLAAELGVEMTDRQSLYRARSEIVLASAACGLAPPIDGATTNMTDNSILESDVQYAKSLGFTAKLCIHPKQVRAVNSGFRPSRKEIEWARSIVAAESDGSVKIVGDQVVGTPVVKMARRILSTEEFG